MKPRKLHMANLPTLKPGEYAKQPRRKSKKAVVVHSLFNDGYPSELSEHAITDYITQAAIWARQTWLRNTDAYEYGVEVQLFVDDRIRDRITPIFEANHVPADDILWFTPGKLEGTFHHEGKPETFNVHKMQSYTDERFKEFDWIIDSDSDVFVMPGKDKKFPFFQRLFDACEPTQLGTCYLTSRLKGVALNPISKRWAMGPDFRTTDESIASWNERFREVAGQEMLDKYWSDDEDYYVCHGGLNLFPAKHFMEHRQSDCEWFDKAGKLLLNDELIFGLWKTMGHPVFDITKLIRFHALHGFSFSNFDTLSRLIEEGEPFLFHYSNDALNTEWRKGIGAPD